MADSRPPGAVPLHLFVGNQSFDIDPVVIEVWIDGDKVVDGSFAVLDQHNWTQTDIYLVPGEHKIVVGTDVAGVELDESFVVVGETWALLEFWTDERSFGPFLRWHLQAEPIGFA